MPWYVCDRRGASGVCSERASSVYSMAGHLTKAHHVDAVVALQEARKLRQESTQPEVAPDRAEAAQAAPEPTQPTARRDSTMKACKFCDRRKAKGLGPCGHHGGDKAPSRKKGKGRPPKPPRTSRPASTSLEERIQGALDRAKRRIQDLRGEIAAEEQQVSVLTALLDG